MTKKKDLNFKTAISRAAQASRQMTIGERTQILLRAGLVSQEQLDQSKRNLPAVIVKKDHNGE